jgi:hypothetical protein
VRGSRLTRTVVVLVPAIALLGACAGNRGTTVTPPASPVTTAHGSTSTGSSATTIPQAAATTTPPTTADGTVGTGYINTDNRTYAEFLQWTGSGREYQGTLDEDEVSGSPPNETLSTDNQSVVAQISGKQLTLTISGDNPLFGQVTGNGFTVNIPQQDGSIGSGTFVSSTPGQFNEVVAELQAAIGGNNRAQAQANAAAAAQAAAQAQLAKEQQAINGDGQAVASDIQSLQGDESSLSGDVNGIQGDLNSEDGDVGTTATDQQQVGTDMTDGNSDEACSDAAEVASDADEVSSDTDEIESDADEVESDLGVLNQDVSRLTQDSQALQAAEAQLPSYATNAPTASYVNGATAQAGSDVTSAINQTNADIAQAGQYEDQAFQDADAAASTGACGGGPETPSPPTTVPAGA